MDETAADFERLVGAVLHRFLRQNAQAVPPDAAWAGLTARLWSLVTERGLPAPLAPKESGTPGGMTEAECAPLVARVLGAAPEPLLREAVRQLVKACFYPEFKACRDSFREVASDGACRRQERERARLRVSGSHCVDCPHWVALGAAEHQTFLAGEWKANADEFLAHRDIFLPEDFRALRQWLHVRARLDAGGTVRPD
ncbi:MAG: hypothetical protein EXS38_04900 [Opitutus sp.]|nr:hypothetical protein [Opitutus sp.]